MGKADIVTVVIVLAATAYAVFAGADFGAGIWQLVARWAGDKVRVRARIERSVAPVWEANHTWLILILVTLWTGFPDVFAAIMTTLYIPISLAAVGIVLRGSAFAFGKLIEGRARQFASGLFTASSIMTPFFMGTVVGAIASGQVPAGGGGDQITSWTGTLPLVIGALFVASGAYIAAVFLVADSYNEGDAVNARFFTRCALGAAVIAGVMAVAGLIVITSDFRTAFIEDGLRGPALPLVIASGIAGLGALVVLLRFYRNPETSPRGVRPLSVTAVVAVIWGWGVAQHPYLLLAGGESRGYTISEAAAPDATLVALLVVFAAAVVIVVPALALLLSLADRDILD